MPEEQDNPRDILAAEEFALPAPDPRLHRSEARDVLAAEEFAVPAPDPNLYRGEAHDVLAAEEFVLPAPDARLRVNSQPLTLPPDPKDPSGVEPAHDILAAEEFAVPAPVIDHAGSDASVAGARQAPGRALVVLAGAAILLSRTLRRRRRSG